MQMQPKTYWKIGIVILAIMLILEIVIAGIVGFAININQNLNPQAVSGDATITAIITIYLVVLTTATALSLLLFAMKNKVGLYLTYALSVFGVVSALISLLSTVLPAILRMNALDAIVNGGMILVEIVVSVALLFCAWKSKSLFEKGGEK